MFPLAPIAGFLARSALMSSPIGGFLRGAWTLAGKVPWQVWAALFAALALWLGFKWHGHEVHKTYVSGYNAGAAAVRAEDAKALADLRAKVAASSTRAIGISDDTRSKNDASLRDIHAAAHALSLSGPGAASCRQLDHPAIPAASGGHEPSNRAGDAALSPMPAVDGPALVAMPWDQALAYGEQHDSFRTEALSWRDWWKRQSDEREKLRKARP